MINKEQIDKWAEIVAPFFVVAYLFLLVVFTISLFKLGSFILDLW